MDFCGHFGKAAEKLIIDHLLRWIQQKIWSETQKSDQCTSLALAGICSLSIRYGLLVRAPGDQWRYVGRCEDVQQSNKLKKEPIIDIFQLFLNFLRKIYSEDFLVFNNKILILSIFLILIGFTVNESEFKKKSYHILKREIIFSNFIY